MLAGKRVLVGISGGIAAYKMPETIRLLKKAGAEVRVVLSPSATDFVTPLSLAVCSGNPVTSTLFDEHNGHWVNHVDLALWADIMLIAPATARTLSSMAQAHTDNALLVTWLSTRCPVIVAPAMDHDMWLSPLVQDQVRTLAQHKTQIIPPAHGSLASGLVGEGRLQEPIQLLRHLECFFLKTKDLKGKTFLISSGGTREALDPVRFLGNESTGKMGAALADVAKAAGATVWFAQGKNSQEPVLTPDRVFPFKSALDLQQIMERQSPAADYIFMAAAVADYRPKQQESQKIKKQSGGLNQIDLTENPDILKGLSGLPKRGTLVGFALETENGMQHARQKLERKKVDFLVLNSMEHKGAGLGHDTNKVSIFRPGKEEMHLPLQSKLQTAVQLINTICS